MRSSRHLLLFRSSCARSSAHISSRILHYQVGSNPDLLNLQFFNSRFYSLAPQLYETLKNPVNPSTRCFSSEPALEPSDADHVVLVDVFAKAVSDEEIKTQLESNRLEITHDLMLNALKSPETSSEVASKVFNWVAKNESAKLSSKSYNCMLGVLGSNGFVKEFWDLVATMKQKGYGVSKGAYVRALAKFEKDGLVSDLENLKGLFASGSIDNSIEKTCSRMSKMIRQEVWGDDLEKRLRDMNVGFSGDMVKMVMENLATDPTKALIFFRWLEEGGLFSHDEQTYNAMARVLGREDCIDRFWNIIDEMRSKGCEMEAATYIRVMDQFTKRKMIDDAVNLYVFASSGANKPSVQECTFLLRKVAVSKGFDINLFSRVVKAFVAGGNALTNSNLEAVVKSLRSVSRLGECNKVLKAMQEAGFVADNAAQRKLAFALSSAGEKVAASEFVEIMEASGCGLDKNTWTSLIEGHCLHGDLDKASECFLKFLEKEGAISAGYAFESLVDAYCGKRKALDACKLLRDQVTKNQLKPRHTTYKMLIQKLLVQGGFKEALSLLEPMKNHGFPPYVDPFIEYVSKSGSGEDAVSFLKAMTVNRFPSTSVVVRVFEAFFKAQRHSEAQDLLSRCPSDIRSHADVLELFYSSRAAQLIRLVRWKDQMPVVYGLMKI